MRYAGGRNHVKNAGARDRKAKQPWPAAGFKIKESDCAPGVLPPRVCGRNREGSVKVERPELLGWIPTVGCRPLRVTGIERIVPIGLVYSVIRTGPFEAQHVAR